MKVFKYLVPAISSLFLSTSSYADNSSLAVDLNYVYNLFDTRYAPKEWKREYCGLDLSVEWQKALESLESNPHTTPKEFYKIISRFLTSTQDYHVGVSFQATEKSTLPFHVKSAQGRYFIYKIDEEALDTNIYKIAVGDELISLNYTPIYEIANGFIETFGRGVPDTDCALADMSITTRLASQGHDVPKGAVKVQLIDKETGAPKSYQMVWNYKPEYYTYHWDKNNSAQKKMNPMIPSMIAADWILEMGAGKKRDYLDGKKSDLPKLGKVVWKNGSNKNFQAYVFVGPNGNLIGFLRLPTYMPHSATSQSCSEELVEIVSKLEEMTTALVIDQTNNGGGSLTYLYSVASLFATEPLKTPRHRIILTPQSVAEARKFVEELRSYNNESDVKRDFGDTDEYFGVVPTLQTIEFLTMFYQFLIDEWEMGKNMTDPTHIMAIDEINPNPYVVYTKPILLLVNELDFSCADFFPALMQDNKRATIMGNRTSGAGGAVRPAHFDTNSGINRVSYTWTLAERSLDGRPIENLGVIPDIEYKTTPEDLINGFEGYKEAILEVLKKFDPS